MPRLEEYAPIVGADTIEELSLVAERVGGRSVLHVNSTAVGGGVAEILHRMVPLLRELGLDARWEVIRGGEDFYAVTKKFHNALHGQPAEFSARDFQVYGEATAENLSRLSLDAEVVFIHDPQPAGLVEKRAGLRNRWVWRCHIDLSRPNERAWGFLRPFVERYDACIVSAPGFAQELRIRQALIAPSIDPLSEKNRELAPEEVRAVLERLAIPTDKPLVTQVSRFDRLKDPIGVIEAFRRAKPYVEARLLLVGGSADDDPEGAQVLAEVRDRASGEPDILVLELPPTSHLEINAIQRASAVVLQKSLREGFGLTVAEALWKGKPVIAGAVGGIPLLIAHKHSGVLVHSVEGAAYWLKRLLSEPDFASRLGANGREHVRQNFLLTRHLRDYLLLILSLDHPGEDFVALR